MLWDCLECLICHLQKQPRDCLETILAACCAAAAKALGPAGRRAGSPDPGRVAWAGMCKEL